ncbi:erythromycin esterase family protein [Azohydromonas caseinilytica]|uniref:Erythromycin esterase family protein n=1 Tax=Azohydromonas caseinilytica TaxID=2728836 RepID=A0A848FK23_9BURK|nr:erythromycin esterase family protein [Azohydromonas caseinilytica]NML18590.1 erythromycin esterase family protein [Azohydromonas caseinilytica]
MGKNREAAVQAIRHEAHPLRDLEDVDRVLGLVGESRIVLLGESTHGTREFYRLRAEITRRLIVEKRFDAVAVEADWPAALRVSRYVQGRSGDTSAEQALGGFERFPRWMWRNTEVVALVQWLRTYNDVQDAPGDKVGFFGLDLYSLRESMQAVLRYLDEVDPEAAQRARARYACFDDFAHHPQAYGHAVIHGLRDDCEREVVLQLTEMLHQAGQRLAASRGRDGGGSDELFYAQQNARVVRNAETYYRAMFAGRTESWNVRDRHMASTLHQLRSHLAAQRERPAHIVVWAHNSHVGDARATDRAERGQLNLGQLVREQQHDPGESFILGFTTHAGSVAAASDWDAPVELKTVRPSRIDSIERLLHESALERFVLPLQRGGSDGLRRALQDYRLARAIGVIYRPETERWSHYFHASLSRQFDAVMHLDQTRALQPLESEHPWESTEEPETYPSGL